LQAKERSVGFISCPGAGQLHEASDLSPSRCGKYNSQGSKASVNHIKLINLSFHCQIWQPLPGVVNSAFEASEHISGIDRPFSVSLFLVVTSRPYSHFALSHPYGIYSSYVRAMSAKMKFLTFNSCWYR